MLFGFVLRRGFAREFFEKSSKIDHAFKSVALGNFKHSVIYVFNVVSVSVVYSQHDILGGRYQPGEQIPPVRQIAFNVSVNPNTVQKAYNILEADGVICSVSGKGSFIAEGDRATEALINAAKDEFKMAAESALRTGLSRETLEEILDTIYKGGKTDD